MVLPAGNVLGARGLVFEDVIVRVEQILGLRRAGVELYPLARVELESLAGLRLLQMAGHRTCLFTDCVIRSMSIPADVSHATTASTLDLGGAKKSMTSCGDRCFP